jgi:hypothetical protein
LTIRKFNLQVKHFNYLGIVLDENLKWKKHTELVGKKISKSSGILCKLKNYLPMDILLNIYNSLVLSYLTYGVIIWGWQSNQLTKIQKKLIRIISNSKYNAHCDPLFRKLKILKLSDICALHDLKFCYKYEHGLLPHYFTVVLNTGGIHDHNTRHHNDPRLPAVSHEFAKHSITYRYPYCFNNMNPNFKDKIHTHSFEGFKFYIKQKMIDSYSLSCHRPHCYVCGH